MTALPPAPFTIKSALDFTDEADNHALIVLHFGYTGAAPTSGNLTTMATSIGTAWTSNFAPLYSTSGGLLTVVCTDLAASNGAQGSASPNVSGTRVGGGLPRSTAMLFNHHIAQRYRGGKGRTYMPLGVAGDITGGGNWGDVVHQQRPDCLGRLHCLDDLTHGCSGASKRICHPQLLLAQGTPGDTHSVPGA